MYYNTEKAEDLTNETIARAIENISKFIHDGKRNSLKRWLFTIQRNIFINEYRKNNKIEFVDVSTCSEYDNYISEDSVKLHFSEDTKNALNNLPLKNRTIIELVFIKGLKYREVSEKMSMPENTIKTKIRDSLFKLKKILKHRKEDLFD